MKAPSLKNITLLLTTAFGLAACNQVPTPTEENQTPAHDTTTVTLDYSNPDISKAEIYLRGAATAVQIVANPSNKPLTINVKTPT